MRLATLKDESRDGSLVVVSKDLSRFAAADAISPNLQSALDNWNVASLALQRLSSQLESGDADTGAFDQAACESPLPRAYQWLDGSAYINHVELVRKARGAKVPESYYNDPLMYQGCSDRFLSPHGDVLLGDEAWGCDMEGEIAVVTDDVPQGVSKKNAASHIKLIMICNDVSLRNLIPDELAKGFGFVQSKPPCAFSPVCVTPDELGSSWQDSVIHLPLCVDYNGAPFGCPNAGDDVTFTMAELVAHAAKTRPLAAGTIIGSGTVSNKGPNGGPGQVVSAGGLGFTCIAELRTIETIETGAPSTAFLKCGDRIRIEMFDETGRSIFGSIDQVVRRGKHAV